MGDLISHGVEAGRLQPAHSVQRLGDFSLICVWTPGDDNGSLDLMQVERVVRSANYYEKKTAFTSSFFVARSCLGRWTMSCGRYWKSVRLKRGEGLGCLHEPRVHA
ncbi:MAG: hypothetical protein DMG63_00650 [Acidobacteria bacterium]|nr:MAG: hypothetical protein DMG63_00650 [Acidobacteriota bacterium]